MYADDREIEGARFFGFFTRWRMRNPGPCFRCGTRAHHRCTVGRDSLPLHFHDRQDRAPRRIVDVEQLGITRRFGVDHVIRQTTAKGSDLPILRATRRGPDQRSFCRIYKHRSIGNCPHDLQARSFLLAVFRADSPAKTDVEVISIADLPRPVTMMMFLIPE